MKMKYDIFISYRREGGAQYARILQLMLQQRGYRVFLDYDELTDGVFSDHIKTAIKESPIFMLVLSKESMRRCINADDWVRQEIALAIEQQKHTVGCGAQHIAVSELEFIRYSLEHKAEQNQHPYPVGAAETRAVKQGKGSEECATKGNQRGEGELPFAAGSQQQHAPLFLGAPQFENQRLTTLHKHQENQQSSQQRYQEPPVVLE